MTFIMRLLITTSALFAMWNTAALACEQVLYTGGTDGLNVYQIGELYTPSGQTDCSTPAGFSDTTSMLSPRFDHAQAVLNDGRVLLVGGASDTATSSCATFSAEIFDPNPTTGPAGFFPTPNEMSTCRLGPTATLLQDKF